MTPQRGSSAAVRLVFDVPVDDAQAMQVSDSQQRLDQQGFFSHDPRHHGVQ